MQSNASNSVQNPGMLVSNMTNGVSNWFCGGKNPVKNASDYLHPEITFCEPRERSPKCERKSLAVWNSCLTGGGWHSLSGSGKGRELSDCCPTLRMASSSSNWCSISSSILLCSLSVFSSLIRDSILGMDLSLEKKNHFRFSCRWWGTPRCSTHALQSGILSTLSGKFWWWTSCLTPTSFIGTGRPGFTVCWCFVPDLCLGKWRSCIVHACLPNGPLIITVTVGWGSGTKRTLVNGRRNRRENAGRTLVVTQRFFQERQQNTVVDDEVLESLAGGHSVQLRSRPRIAMLQQRHFVQKRRQRLRPARRREVTDLDFSTSH